MGRLNEPWHQCITDTEQVLKPRTLSLGVTLRGPSRLYEEVTERRCPSWGTQDMGSIVPATPAEGEGGDSQRGWSVHCVPGEGTPLISAVSCAG